MRNEYKYPTTYELQEVFKNIANKKFLNEFAQMRGIFFLHMTQQEISVELANLFYDEVDLELIRKEAYTEIHNHTLGGFIIKGIDKNFNLKTYYENIRQNGDYEKNIVLNQLVRINNENSNSDYKGSLQYTKSRPARIEFLQYETSSFEFFITDLQNGTWQVEIDCSRSMDVKELESIITKNLPRETYSLDIIYHDTLSNELTIHFFDKLAQEGMSEEWNFIDVKHLTVKQG